MSFLRLAVRGAVRASRQVGSQHSGLHAEAKLAPLQGFFHSSSHVRDASEQRSPASDKVKHLVEEIAALNLLEVADLTDLLRKRLNIPEMSFGVPMAAGAAPAAGGQAAATKEEPKVEKTSFDVKLEKFDAAAKIKIIKEVRALTTLGLKEAKDLVEKTPTVVKTGVSKEEAEEIIKKLTAAGATASME